MRMPLEESLARAFHASICCDEPHQPGSIFVDMANAVVAMVADGTDPSDRETGICPFCGVGMMLHSDGHMFRCGWLALREAKRIADG